MKFQNQSIRKIATILFDEYHSESWSVSYEKAAEMQPDRPENSSYYCAASELSAREFVVERNEDQEISVDLLRGKDVLVLIHPCNPEIESTTSQYSPKLSQKEIDAVCDFVEGGGGLFVVSEYENEKYGNNLNELVTRFGITIDSFSTVTDRTASINEEKTHILGDFTDAKDDVLIGVSKVCFYRAGACKVKNGARILVAASVNAKPERAGLVAVCEYGRGRVVVVNDSDLFGDEYIQKFDHLKLWLNLFYWVSEQAFGSGEGCIRDNGDREQSSDWLRLKGNINSLRQLHRQRRQEDNTYVVESSHREQIRLHVAEIKQSITNGSLSDPQE